MRSRHRFLPVTLFLVLLAVEVRAEAVPLEVVHTGRLLASDDTPVNGTRDLVFRFHSRAIDTEGEGSVVWEHAFEDVAIRNGFYSVVLGTPPQPPLDLEGWANGQEQRWLSVSIDSVELSPRLKFVPAAAASLAFDAQRLGGRPADDYVLAEALSQPGTLNDADNPVDWTRLKNVPAALTDGTDALLREVSTGAGLVGNGTEDAPLAVDQTLLDALTEITIGDGLAGDGTEDDPLRVADGAVDAKKLAASGCDAGQILRLGDDGAWTCAAESVPGVVRVGPDDEPGYLADKLAAGKGLSLSVLPGASQRVLVDPKVEVRQLDADLQMTATDFGTTLLFDAEAETLLRLVPIGAGDVGRTLRVFNEGDEDVTIEAALNQSIEGVRSFALHPGQSVELFVAAGPSWRVRRGGRPVLQREVFTTNGTFERRPGVWYYNVIVTGGGGGSGGTNSNNRQGGAGGAGGTAIKVVRLPRSVTEVPVTVGTGGSAAAAGHTNAGGAGGTSRFGSYVSATGGAGGSGAGQSYGDGEGGRGGIGEGGDINLRGQGGAAGIGTDSQVAGAQGGASYWGSGPRGAPRNTSGMAGDGYGSGASGGRGNGSYGGAAGAPGVVVVEWWE